METITKTKQQVASALARVVHFDNETLLSVALDFICSGSSVIVDAVCYIGNGRWEDPKKKKRYRYKMIVPIMSDDGQLYSTDLYQGLKSNAARGEYGIYIHTRQLVIEIAGIIPTDYAPERFGFGYKDGKYGYNKISVQN